jgi:hypothetical protein
VEKTARKAKQLSSAEENILENTKICSYEENQEMMAKV